MVFTEYTVMHIPFFRLMQIALPLSLILRGRSYPLLTDQTRLFNLFTRIFLPDNFPSGIISIRYIYILTVKSSFLTSRALADFFKDFLCHYRNSLPPHSQKRTKGQIFSRASNRVKTRPNESDKPEEIQKKETKIYIQVRFLFTRNLVIMF